MKVTPTTIAISACAVLLALNLIATTSPAANDVPGHATGPPVPTIVKLLPISHCKILRVWSDGFTDLYQRTCDLVCDWESFPQAGAVDHPFPVVDAVLASGHDQGLMMTFGDGRVDMVGGLRCTIAGIGTPSFCTGDVDRSGTVGIEDFLIVLSQWGCQ